MHASGRISKKLKSMQFSALFIGVQQSLINNNCHFSLLSKDLSLPIRFSDFFFQVRINK